MYQMKNFQTLADHSKNCYSFFNITKNFDGLKATFSYLINSPFQQIKLQTYCIFYISYCKQYIHLADSFSPFPGSQKGKYFLQLWPYLSWMRRSPRRAFHEGPQKCKNFKVFIKCEIQCILPKPIDRVNSLAI